MAKGPSCVLAKPPDFDGREEVMVTNTRFGALGNIVVLEAMVFPTYLLFPFFK